MPPPPNGRQKADRPRAERIVSENRKALHDYHILETFEAGVVLLGTAVPLALLGIQKARRHRTRTLPIAASLAVLAGGLLMRRVVMEAGNRSAERPQDYFRLTSGRPGRGA